MDRKVAGFSILELLVIMAILSILMYVGISQYIRYKADRELMRQANMLAEEISWVRYQALAKETHGIKIDVGSYTIFKDSDGNCNFSTGDSLVGVVSFTDRITANTLTVVFDRKGYPRNSNCALGLITITLKNTNNSTKNIKISRYGRTTIE